MEANIKFTLPDDKSEHEIYSAALKLHNALNEFIHNESVHKIKYGQDTNVVTGVEWSRDCLMKLLEKEGVLQLF